jgi:S1-C subfamily serine protease
MCSKPILQKRPGYRTLSWLMVLSLSGALCVADDLSERGREVFKKNRHSVVTVQIVIKSKFSMGGMGGQSNESRQDVTGAIIDSSGLTVLSLAATDPGQMMQNMFSGMSDDDSKFKMETELSDVKILLDDGTEVPAEVVLRDKDLDLAFVRPKAKLTAQLTPLDLSKTGKVDILDQVIALNRLGNAAGRAYAASVERISAIVERPRLFYVPETSLTTTSLGAPAFTLDGKLVGLFVMRALKGRGAGGAGMMGMQPGNVTGIILPAEDILKAAKQVPAAGEEKGKDQN